MAENEISKTERQFERVVQFAVSLSIGLMMGFVWSIKQVNPQLEVKFSIASVAAFLIGGIFTWFAWRGITHGGRHAKIVFIVFSIVLLGVTIGGFAYGLRGIGDLLNDFVIGTAFALFAVAIVGFMLWRTIRFFNKDSERD